MKYIIEIEDTPMVQGDRKVYRAKGFNTLVFDEAGLSKLKKMKYDFHPGDVVKVYELEGGTYKGLLVCKVGKDRHFWMVMNMESDPPEVLVVQERQIEKINYE